MSYYRLYFMNRCNGHIDRVEDLQARDDNEAVETAQPLCGSVPVELWEGIRKVHRFETRATALAERNRAHRASPQHEATYVQADAAE